MKQRRIVFDKGTVEAMARLQQQDDQFCRLMRAAIDRGDESCPTGVSTTPSTQRPIVNYSLPRSKPCGMAKEQ
jgi:hypothetical protein